MTSPAVPPWLRVVGPALAVIVVQLVLFPVSPGVWLQGLVIGLLNALVVLGMMLVYRANRVINMAQASVGALPASLGIGMVLFGAPSLVTAGWLGVAAGAVIGLAAVVLGRRPRRRRRERGRPLRSPPPWRSWRGRATSVGWSSASSPRWSSGSPSIWWWCDAFAGHPDWY